MMKCRISFNKLSKYTASALLATMLLVCLPNNAMYAQKERIIAQFEHFKTDITGGNVETAWGVLTQSSKDYLENILGHILHSDSVTVSALAFHDKLLILSARQRIPHEALDKMDGRQFFATAVQKGLLLKSDLQGTFPGDVSIDKQDATLHLQSAAQKLPMTFAFSKENEQWKIDIRPFLDATGSIILKAGQGLGKEENAFLTFIVESVPAEGHLVDIWKPVQ